MIPFLSVACGMVALCFVPATASGQTWNGSLDDLWTTGANWNGGVAPNSSSAVVSILSAADNPVTLNASTSISTLTMGASTSLDITAGAFSVFGASISNGGAIGLFSLLQLNNSVTLSGAGTLTLAGGQIGTSGSQETLTNQSTIAGYGTIGSDEGADYPYVSLTNRGTINANSSANVLFIGGSGSTFTNSGTLEATAGGVLQLDTSPINDSGGKITAFGANSTVEISSIIQGGTLITSGGGIVETAGNATLDGSTDGAVTLASGSTYTGGSGTTTSLIGTLNLGTTTSSTLALTGNLQLTGNATVSGPGSITMTGGQIGTSGNGETLTNASTLQGYGLIGSNSGSDYPFLSLANTGTVNANSSGNTLTVGGIGASIANTGLFEATGGGTLQLNTSAVIVNAGGNISANGSGSTVNLTNVTVQGGTLNTLNGGAMGTTGNSTLDGSTLGAITLSDGSTYTSVNGTTSLLGNLKLGTSTGSTFALTGNLQLTGNATVSGPGSITMTGGQIGTSGGQEKLTNASTLQGYGLIGSNNGSDSPYLSLANSGTVNANSVINTLTIGGSGASITNTGLFEATGGGTLQLESSAAVVNTGGSISANGSGSTVVLNGVTVQGGVLNTMNGGVMETGGGEATLDGLTNAAITLKDRSTYTAPVGTVTGITGTLNLGASTGSNFALAGQLQLKSDATLAGPGTLTLNSNGGNTAQIGTNGTPFTLTNNSTIQGAGLIGSNAGALYDLMSLTNNGTVNASGGTLDIEGNNTVTTNNGILSVQATSILDITDTFSNFNSTTNTLTGGTYIVNGGALQFNNANIVTNAAYIDLVGSTSQIINQSNANALVSFTKNAAAGTFQIESGYNFTTAGLFTNNGSLIIGDSDKFKVSGSLTNFASSTLTGGTYNVAGILQFGANGTTLTTNDANLTLLGPSAKVENLGGGNLLTGLANNDSGATFKVAAGGSFTTTGALTNAGALDLEQGSSLTIAGNLTNSGTVTTNGSNLGGGANTLTVLGTLNNTDLVTIGANNDTTDIAKVGLLLNSASFTVGTGATLDLTTTGTDTNTSTINLDGATLKIGATETLSGAQGIIDLSNSSANLITGGASNLTLANEQTIEGSGTISNLKILNLGTLLANQSTPLIILPSSGGLDNKGIISVNSGSAMEIGTSAGGALTNFAGTTLTGGNYNISGTLQFGASGTSLVTNAATITLSGANAQIIDFGGHDILAAFAANTSAGKFTLASGATLATSSSTFSNAGLFDITVGSKFTGGAGFNFTQTAGTTTVDGLLTSTTLGTVNLNGGSLFGTGTVNETVVDSATLTPGDSATSTGSLAVRNTYVQTSTGALDVAIDGTTAGKFDVLNVSKAAFLNGTLNISLVSGFVPAVGSKFDILNASSITGTFATITGISINSSEHFTVTVNGADVVLTVVAGAGANTPTASFSSLIRHPYRLLGLAAMPTPGKNNGYEVGLLRPVTGSRLTLNSAGGAIRLLHGVHRLDNVISAALFNGAALQDRMRLETGLNVAPLGEAGVVAAHITTPFIHAGSVGRGFRPMDDPGSLPMITPAAAASTSTGSSLGFAPSASALSSLNQTNHMRFECGVDLKALLNTSPRQIVRALWAAPDSPRALAIGYMSFNGSH